MDPTLGFSYKNTSHTVPSITSFQSYHKGWAVYFSRLVSAQLVSSCFYTGRSSSRTEQSKQYLQVRWRAHRRRRNGRCTSMALVRICSSAARSWVSLCSPMPLIFIRDQASAPNVTWKQGLKVVWSQKKVGANQISMLNALWDGVLTSRGHFKGNLSSFSVSAARDPAARVCRSARAHSNEVLK